MRSFRCLENPSIERSLSSVFNVLYVLIGTRISTTLFKRSLFSSRSTADFEKIREKPEKKYIFVYENAGKSSQNKRGYILHFNSISSSRRKKTIPQKNANPLMRYRVNNREIRTCKTINKRYVIDRGREQKKH